MRTVLAFLLLVGSGVTQVSAQAGGNNAVQRITQSLSLTQAQVDLVNENLDERNPGTMWTLVGQLAPTLSDAQKATLPNPPTRGQGAVAGRGGQGGAGRAGNRQAPDAAMQAVTRFGRDATLGLSSEQSARLDALDASQSQAGARGTLSPEMSALLTPAQLELAQLHRGPTRAMRGGRGR